MNDVPVLMDDQKKKAAMAFRHAPPKTATTPFLSQDLGALPSTEKGRTIIMKQNAIMLPTVIPKEADLMSCSPNLPNRCVIANKTAVPKGKI